MIKDLIKDIAYENITLSQALTRAKIIASKTENQKFIDWLQYELVGYPNGEVIPKYRILNVETIAIAQNSQLQKWEIQLGIGESLKKPGVNYYEWRTTESIEMLEYGIKNSVDDFIYIKLDQEKTDFFAPFINLPQGQFVKYVCKKIGKSMFMDIVNKSKNKLLETLLQLDKEFPNMENEFKDNEVKEKVNQIINTNIYGNLTNSNLGIGENFSQSQSIEQTQLNKTIEELKSLGVPEDSIEELREIVDQSEDKESISKKLLNWAGNLAGKTIEKGVELKLPQIIETIQNLV